MRRGLAIPISVMSLSAEATNSAPTAPPASSPRRIAEALGGLHPADVAAATAYLRRLDLTLRTADALNIAIAERTGCTLLNFDRKMAEGAQAIGLSIAAG